MDVSKGVQIAVGAVLVAGLLGWYASTRLEGGSFVYYQTLEEFQTAVPGGAVRVHGYVSLGTIERDVAGQVVRFRVQNDPPHAGGSPTGAMRVIYQSLETPDLFKDGAEVVVEGELRAKGTEFHATNVLAKCPSKFEAKQAEASL
ncbi:MAG: cytochrome c maturation protein CcmE [Myxococcota bacterium]